MPTHHHTPADATTVNCGPVQGTVRLTDLDVWAYRDPNFPETTWIAHFPLLDLYTQGETPEHAFNGLTEAIHAYIESVQENASKRLNATTTTTTTTTHAAETDRT